MDINSTITRYEKELLEHTVPFWEDNCEDQDWIATAQSLTAKNTCGCSGESSICSRLYI